MEQYLPASIQSRHGKWYQTSRPGRFNPGKETHAFPGSRRNNRGISERNQAKGALFYLEEKYRVFYKSMMDAIVRVDNGRGLAADLSGMMRAGWWVMKYRAGLIRGELTIKPRKNGGTEAVFRVAKPSSKQ